MLTNFAIINRNKNVAPDTGLEFVEMRRRLKEIHKTVPCEQFIAAFAERITRTSTKILKILKEIDGQSFANMSETRFVNLFMGLLNTTGFRTIVKNMICKTHNSNMGKGIIDENTSINSYESFSNKTNQNPIHTNNRTHAWGQNSQLENSARV
jgi:hypothetical protein